LDARHLGTGQVVGLNDEQGIEGSLDPRVAPAGILPGHSEDEIPEFSGLGGAAGHPAPGAVVLAGNEGPVPAEKGAGRHPRGDPPERLASQEHGAFGKSSALGFGILRES